MKVKFFYLLPTGDLKRPTDPKQKVTPHIIAVYAEAKADKKTIKTVHAWNLSSRYLSGKSISPERIDFETGELHPSDVSKHLVTRMSEGYYVGEHAVGYKTPAQTTTSVLQLLCKQLEVSYTACSKETATKYFKALVELPKQKEKRRMRREFKALAVAANNPVLQEEEEAGLLMEA